MSSHSGLPKSCTAPTLRRKMLGCAFSSAAAIDTADAAFLALGGCCVGVLGTPLGGGNDDDNDDDAGVAADGVVA